MFGIENNLILNGNVSLQKHVLKHVVFIYNLHFHNFLIDSSLATSLAIDSKKMTQTNADAADVYTRPRFQFRSTDRLGGAPPDRLFRNATPQFSTDYQFCQEGKNNQGEISDSCKYIKSSQKCECFWGLLNRWLQICVQTQSTVFFIINIIKRADNKSNVISRIHSFVVEWTRCYKPQLQIAINW